MCARASPHVSQPLTNLKTQFTDNRMAVESGNPARRVCSGSVLWVCRRAAPCPCSLALRREMLFFNLGGAGRGLIYGFNFGISLGRGARASDVGAFVSMGRAHSRRYTRRTTSGREDWLRESSWWYWHDPFDIEKAALTKINPPSTLRENNLTSIRIQMVLNQKRENENVSARWRLFLTRKVTSS